MSSEREQPNLSATPIGSVAQTLTRVRRTAWAMLVMQHAGRVLAVLLGAVVVAGVLDYFLRTPTWFRAGAWAGGVALLAWALWRTVRPAVGFHPGLTEVALRIERSDAGRAAGLGGVLAAGLELGAAGRTEPVVREAIERFGRVRMSSVLSGTRLSRVGAGLGCAIVAAGVLALMFPSLAGIGASRVLTPWAGAQWPKRTEVADATSREPHARGTGLLLRAVVLKNAGGLGTGKVEGARVWGKYRVLVDGTPGPTRRVLLTGQDRAEVARVADGAGEGTTERSGALFEYLVEPWGLAPRGAAGAEKMGGAAAVQAWTLAELEYWFETEDDATPPGRVLLVEPPSIVATAAEITPPAYVGAGEGRTQLDLGTGTTESASAPALLAGSRVRVEITLNKAVPRPEGAEALARSLGEAGAAVLRGGDARATFEEQRWTLEWTLRDAMRLEVRVQDEYGISSPDAGFTFPVQEDRVPAAAVTVPDEDRTVLPTATVELAGEGRDDVGLSWAALEYRVAHPPKGSEGAPPEAAGEATELARLAGERTGTGLPKELVVRTTLDLSKLGVESGDEVWVTAAAADAFELDGKTHEVARSAPRKLRVISQEQLIEQVWEELSGVRRSAMATDEEQARLTRDASRNGEASRLERSQAGVSDRVQRDREALERVERRMRENGLQDETLDQVLRDADRLLDQAGKASTQASEKLRQAAESEQKAGTPDQSTRAEAGRRQDQVREELGRLIDLLDQGQDSWATKRAIERLLEQQRQLQQQTGQAGQQTTGKAPEQLTAQERQELERIAGEQQALSQQASEAVQQMAQAEPKLRQNDPAAADAMSQAARQAQQQRLTERMQQASQQVQQNQTNRAQQEQEEAIRAMEQMLEAMQNTARNRDEVLRRKLASLIESLEGLIKDQQSQLGLLAAGIEKNDVAGLDRGMARLHQNTLGVLDEAAQGPRELQPVADLIGEAAEAQSTSVLALRSQPANTDEATGQEQISLAKLTEAKEQAERLDREAADRQARRKRDELKKMYREALSEQVALRAETEPLVGVEASRRTRATARTLGERQGALQDRLATLERETKELSEATMFSFAHRRLDAATGGAAKRLGEGEATRDVTRDQDAAVRVLNQLLQSLEEANKKEDEFRQQQGAQQQGGSGQQQSGQTPVVPPMAEVKLLRSMQEEAGVLTKGAEEGKDAAAAKEAAALQGELAAHGEELLKKLMERRRPPAPGGGAPPAPTGPEEPGNAEPKPGEEPQPGKGGNG
jgi:hypothetical protein